MLLSDVLPKQNSMNSRYKNILCVLIAIVSIACGNRSKPQDREIDYLITYFPDSTVKEIVQRRNGLLDGKAFLFNEDGTKQWEFQYVNDVRDGTQLTYVFGYLTTVEHYKNGKLEGWARYYSTLTGLLKEEGRYSNGKMNGLWYEYYGKELLDIYLYKDDSLIRFVYRNKKYPDRSQPLPDLELDCCDRRHPEVD